MANPYSQNLGFGAYQPQGVQGGASNPYLQTNVNNALDSVTRNYQNTIAPQMASRMASANSFGNTGLQSMDLAQQRGLADSLGATASNMYGQAYTTDRANDLAFTNANNNNATQRYGYDQQLAGTRYSSDNALKGSMYGSDQSLAGTKYASDNSRAASMYSADSNLFGNLYGTDASIYNNALNNATTQRGQDVQYGIAGMNNATTRMGQNQSYDLGLRSNDLGYDTLDANIANRNFDNAMTAANFGLSVNNNLNAQNGQAITAGQQIQDAPLSYQQQLSNMQNSIGNGYGTQTTTPPSSQLAGALGGGIAANQVANNLGFNTGGGSSNWATGTGNYSQYVNPDYGQFF